MNLMQLFQNTLVFTFCCVISKSIMVLLERNKKLSTNMLENGFPKLKFFVNFGLILRWALHVRWVGTTLKRLPLHEEMNAIYSHVEIH